MGLNPFLVIGIIVTLVISLVSLKVICDWKFMGLRDDAQINQSF